MNTDLRQQLKMAVLLLLLPFLGVLLGCRSGSNTSQLTEEYKQKNVMWASMVGDLPLLEELHAAGHKLDVQDSRAFDWSPLIAAIYHDHPEIVSYLISQHVPLDAKDRDGETALMWAIKIGDTNSVRLLLENGASITIKNNFGVNAFKYAESSDYRAILLEWLNKHKSNSQ